MPAGLFVQNGPRNRFGFIAHALVQRGWSCALINGEGGSELPGCRTVRWKPDRQPTAGIFPPAERAELDLMRGRFAADGALKLKADGFVPNLIIGHPGWGEMLFMREVFPKARQIQIGEFYYRTSGADVGFDPEFEQYDFDFQVKVHAKNATLAMSLAEADRIVAPTQFQAGLLPEVFRPRISVIHEGIDTAVARPKLNPQLRTQSGYILDRTRPVVTFVNRRFEPLRGFHIFMRALPRLLADIPDVHVLLVGMDAPGGYGKNAPPGTSWKQVMLNELKGRLDLPQIHFTGPISYELLLTAFGLSAAHTYLTYPFVLSWSLLDAMACECLIVGSDTAPVREVIEPGVNGLLVDFFAHDALAATLTAACREPERFAALRKTARETVVSRFDRATVCEPAWLALIDEVLQS